MPDIFGPVASAARSGAICHETDGFFVYPSVFKNMWLWKMRQLCLPPTGLAARAPLVLYGVTANYVARKVMHAPHALLFFCAPLRLRKQAFSAQGTQKKSRNWRCGTFRANSLLE